MKNNATDWVIHTDGGARGNPGPAAIGVVIEKNGKTVTTLKKTIGVTTNNVAEYQAVIEALKALQSLTERTEIGENVGFFLDSLLVVQQLNGIYKIKNENLGILHGQVKNLEKMLACHITYTYTPREKNRAADALVNQALDEKRV